ncbi:gas vesicle protein GvpU [Virgibacillus halodenitrificans]|uniref:gas vesicle accessory protein GvpU n=1 Tax=Virgibacillus halodenitrificans TaxID=1482 RepID=UPI0007610563|nr:gas vesicle accessory protein GvpU [Virgibacillus halodenitrificans]MCJ0933248.1 gas vesicle protein GvpU [Virgibacillus halodenitrificans]
MSENAKDNILEFFVAAANKHDFELDISLLVHGAIVTGTLISATEYFDNMSQSFEDGSDISQKVSQQLSQAGESADSGNQQEVNFIHLKNTKIYCGDSKPTPSKGEILWRGKLVEVDSFFLGRIAEPKSKSKNNDK